MPSALSPHSAFPLSSVILGSRPRRTEERFFFFST